LGEIEVRATDQVVDKNPLQRLFGYPPITADEIKQLPIFYKDPQFEIQSIFYLGYEFTLLLFNIITYATFDVLTGSTLISIVITYTFDKIFSSYRNWLGERNISSKTFIDDRFLI
jgi:meckelin